jgi:type IV pilus assembly protein PilC
MAVFCAQIAMILKAGILVAEGVTVMAEDAPNPEGRAILSQVATQMDAGQPFAEALALTGCFPAYMVDMVRIGERAGKLEEVLGSLTSFYEREETLAENLRSAVTYPLVMITMMFIVIAVLLVKVLPVFADMFAQMNLEMNGVSLLLLSIGTFIGRFYPVIIGVVVLIVVLFMVLRRTAAGRRGLENFSASFILTRSLLKKVAAGRFASAMAMMMQSGMDTEEALTMTGRVIEQAAVKQKIAACQEEIGKGRSFAESLEEKQIFPGIYAKMVTVGFKTGTADEVMNKLAERMDREVEAHLGRLVAIIEPTLVVILSLLVGLILISVMLPLMNIMQSLGA